MTDKGWGGEERRGEERGTTHHAVQQNPDPFSKMPHRLFVLCGLVHDRGRKVWDASSI
jgi:hypothetical protein